MDGQFFFLGCISMRRVYSDEYVVGYLDSPPIFCLENLMVCDYGWIDVSIDIDIDIGVRVGIGIRICGGCSG